jgi:hypothetical protein
MPTDKWDNPLIGDLSDILTNWAYQPVTKWAMGASAMLCKWIITRATFPVLRGSNPFTHQFTNSMALSVGFLLDVVDFQVVTGDLLRIQ